MSHTRTLALAYLLIIPGLIAQANGQTYRNIALNPNDVRAQGYGFPHASSNSEYPCIYPQDTTGGNHCVPDTVFLALDAINGDTNNASHGSMTYASWGPQLHVPGLWWKVDFGHEVSVDKVKIWVRADWAGIPSHDSYWKQATLVFSNGSRDTIFIDSLRTGQEFPFTSRTTQSVTITDFVASDTTKWCAFTEVQVWGYDPPTPAMPMPAKARCFASAAGSVLWLGPGMASSRLRVPGKVARVELYSIIGKKVWEITCNGGPDPSFVTPPASLNKGIFRVRYVADDK